LIFSLESNASDSTDGSTAGLKVVYQASYTGMLKGLLASTDGPGYFLINERNQIKILRQTGIETTLTRGLPKPENKEVTRSLNSIFGRGTVAAPSDTPSAVEDGDAARQQIILATTDSEEPGSAERGLESVLRFTTLASAPTPAELFHRVVSVLAK